MKYLLIAFLLLYAVPRASSETIGIDVSAWQETINWNKVALTNVKFALLRASVSRNVDKYFEANYAGALAAGIPVVGVYYYSYSMTPSDCAADADFVITNLKGKKVPIYFDMEEQKQADLGRQKVTDMMIAFTKRCQSYGYECNIYSNKNWYKNVFYPDQLAALGCKFWIAAYGLDDGTMNTKYKPNVGEYIWQYTSKGKVDGVPWNVDMNVMYGTPSPTPTPTPTPSTVEKMVKIIATSINRRSKPVLDSSNIVGYYVNGQTVQVKGISSDGQFYLDSAGYYFTSNSQYVKDLTGYVNCDALNVRQNPNTSATVLSLIYNGNTVSILKEQNDWVYVKLSSGLTGWCAKQYITYN